MTALEIRLLGYGIFLILIVGGSGVGGYRIASHHYQALLQADRAAQQEALLLQQQKTIAAQAAQASASEAAQRQIEDAKASSVLLGSELAASVRHYAALHSELLSATARPAASADAAGQGTQSDPGLAELAGAATAACEEDAATLSALQAWAKTVSRSP